MAAAHDLPTDSVMEWEKTPRNTDFQFPGLTIKTYSS